jgi:hypothetical protein
MYKAKAATLGKVAAFVLFESKSLVSIWAI